MSKIQKDHLNRAAYVYVRQSSLAQVSRTSKVNGGNMPWLNAPKTLGGRTSA